MVSGVRSTTSRCLAQRHSLLVTCVLVACALAACAMASCSTGPSAPTAPTGAVSRGECPVDPVPVAVSVDQWADVVRSIGGDCVDLTTIVTSGATDPHDFEPRPSDLLALDRARLVVVNGMGYDTWATKALEAMPRRPSLIEAGTAGGRANPDDDSVVDPHLWYDPLAVEQVSSVVAGRLGELLPAATGYIDRRAARWRQHLSGYRSELDRVASSVGGLTYVATEPLFDATARELGLRDVTPPGYRSAVANGSEPTPGQLADLQAAIRGGEVDVVISDAGTEGPAAESVREIARTAGVPVVAVTETRPSGESFLEWQRAQVRAVTSAVRS